MKRRFYIILSILSMATLFICVCAPASHAQNYLGDIQAIPEVKEDTYVAEPTPKIFSSQVKNSKEAEKLDKTYNSLFETLWNLSREDSVYQKRLFEKIEPKKFKTTRYAAEFDTILKEAMADLNENYKLMAQAIYQANQTQEDVVKTFNRADAQVLSTLWREQINIFQKKAEKYYQMHYAFLKTYRTLIHFILSDNGGYYYQARNDTVNFLNYSDYQFYGENIDRLNKIRYEQSSYLKKIIPDNIDTILME